MRTIVALQADDRRAGKVFLKSDDVLDFRAAPAVDRLIVVADAADVLVRLRQQPQPEILDDVGVLVFVDQYIFPSLLILRQDGVVLAVKQPEDSPAAGRRNRRR